MVTRITPLPARGEVFFDSRDADKSCRVSWHPTEDAFILSIWRGGQCAATFELTRAEAPAFLNAFVTQLAESAGAPARRSDCA